MAGVDFEKDFPQPPAAPARAARGVIVEYANPELHRHTIELKCPIRVTADGSSRVIEAVTLRRLTSGELIRVVEADGAPEDDADLVRHVMAAMAGEPVEVLDGLAPDDAGRVAAAAIPLYPALVRAAADRIEAMLAAQMEAGD